MFFKNYRFTPILGSKEESMACALRRYGVTNPGNLFPVWFKIQNVVLWINASGILPKK
ncbi:MAG: hypothetical protein P8X79_06985 [Reinekea sp.]